LLEVTTGLDDIEVALAWYQQTQVAAQDVAGGHATFGRQRGIPLCQQWPQAIKGCIR